jgi:hypothetical protein
MRRELRDLDRRDHNLRTQGSQELHLTDDVVDLDHGVTALGGPASVARWRPPYSPAGGAQ